MTLTQVQTQEITLTEAAAQAVQDMLAKRELTDYALRVFIQGGGCSGYQYGMALEGQPRDNDLRFDQHGIQVVVDDMSINYLRGAKIDFVDDVMGSGFKIDNPNAVSSCGCGHSFNTAESAAAEGEGGACNCGSH